MKHALLALLVALAAAMPLHAQQPEDASDSSQAGPPAEASPTPATPDAGTADPLDQTMRELQDLRRESPAIEPTGRGNVEYVPSRVGAPSVTVDIDRSVLGVAPGQPLPTLKREGDFIVKRRGRLIRSPDGAHVLFRFEADSAESQEPPMVLQACRNLEAMEDHVSERGDAVVFVVSGQVHVYRGANYLLPTMWTLAPDQGNLQP